MLPILFDSHLHIIDSRFPLVANQGYLPPEFSAKQYQTAMQPYHVLGGAVVSGSFQAFDQDYLLAALQALGEGFVGVTQLPASVTDQELIQLNAAGIRAIRFNIKRGGSEQIQYLEHFAQRVFDVVGWHTELYVYARELDALFNTVIRLPAVSVDHLGLSQAGLPTLLKLVERGVHVKATGFGRVDFAVAPVLCMLFDANPDALMFGTDLPSTRAPRPYQDTDYALVLDTLGTKNASKIFFENAARFYKCPISLPTAH